MDPYIRSRFLSGRIRAAGFIFVLGLVFGLARSASAQSSAPQVAAAPVSHVRAADSVLDAVVAEGVRRSPSFEKLAGRLEQSSVFVYIVHSRLPRGLTGRLVFAAAAGGWRYVRIEIDCEQAIVNQTASLGHELQHAVEIADADSAVDTASVGALYETIGFASDNSGRRFETAAARDAGTRIRRELLSWGTASSH